MQIPSLYLHEMCHQIELASGIQVFGATVCCTLRRNGINQKKWNLQVEIHL